MEQESPSLSFLYLLSILLPGSVATVAVIFLYHLCGGSLPAELHFLVEFKTSVFLFLSFLMGLLIDRGSQQMESILTRYVGSVRKDVFENGKRQVWKKDLLPHLERQIYYNMDKTEIVAKKIQLVKENGDVNYTNLNKAEHYVRYCLIKEGLHDNIEKDKSIYKLLRNLIVPLFVLLVITIITIGVKIHQKNDINSYVFIAVGILMMGSVCAVFFMRYRFDYTLQLYQIYRFHYVLNKEEK